LTKHPSFAEIASDVSQQYLCRQQYHDTKLWVTTACRSPEMGAHSNLVRWLTVNQQHISRQQTKYTSCLLFSRQLLNWSMSNVQIWQQ